MRYEFALAVTSALLAGCTIGQKVSVQPTRVRTMQTTAPREDAFTAAVKGTLASGWTLGGSDRVVGVVQTEWKDTVQNAGLVVPICSGVGMDTSESRRLMFSITVEETKITITPKAQLCHRRICNPVNNMSGSEIGMLEVLEGNIAHELAGRSPVQVEQGMLVVVENMKGYFYRGIVLLALPSTLVLDVDGKRHEIPTNEIKSLSVIVPR